MAALLLLAATCLPALLFAPAAGEKLEAGRCTSKSEAKPLATDGHEVWMLVTRHGVSCANVVDKWNAGDTSMGYFAKMALAAKRKTHIMMKDPYLCSAGEQKSEEAGKQTRDRLSRDGTKVDAVLSSVLVRAMQTAIFQYFGGKRTKSEKLWVMPHIRESDPGLDNLPVDIAEHRANPRFAALLKQRKVDVDTSYADEAGYSVAGDWDKFTELLGQSFVPKRLAEKLAAGKPADEPLVLAVVTHSNFMNRGDLKRKCKGKYKGEKAWNNQVVLIKYRFEMGRLELMEDEECIPIADGTNIYDKGGKDPVSLCRKDIGEECIGTMKVSPPCFEEDFKNQDDKLRKDQDKAEAREKTLEQQTYSLGKPLADAFLSEDRDEAERIQHQMQKQVSAREDVSGEVQKYKADRELLRENFLSKTCWAGGNPDIPEA